MASQSVLDLDHEDVSTDGGHHDPDGEICFGSVRGDIVGLQYYAGTVSWNEQLYRIMSCVKFALVTLY